MGLINVPFQVPVPIVPKVVIELCPTYEEEISITGVVVPVATVIRFEVPETDVTVPSVGVTQVGAPEETCDKYCNVPDELTGNAWIVPVPLPYKTPLDASVAAPVPPCATVTAAALVRIVALALGSVNVFSDVAGPENFVNPLPVPPYPLVIIVPFQSPVLIVPNVVKFVEPAQVDKAVFSTLPSPTSAFTNPVGELITGDDNVLFVKVSVPPNVLKVPVVGRVTLVAAVLVNVVVIAPDVVKFPPSVIVFDPLFIPVPP